MIQHDVIQETNRQTNLGSCKLQSSINEIPERITRDWDY
jgi:riboflavin synthase alpha subunit